MMKHTAPPLDLAQWNRLACEGAKLWLEASQVMWLRGLRLMAGGKLAEREAERMVREKLIAAMMLWPFVARGGAEQSPEQVSARVLQHYRGPVRANRRRLSR